jgi:molybdate transport system regulatory protein
MKKPLKDFFNKGKYAVKGSLWIEGDDIRFLGPGPVELLLLIEETGSINQAAKKMGMSYKKAWDIVNRLNSKTVSPLVITAAGGEKGGGSSLSDDAKQIIAYHQALRERFQKFLEAETHALNNT